MPRPAVAPYLAAATLAGVAVTGYAVAETRRFVLREATMPVLPPGHAPLRVLHLSDLHLTPGQRRKQAWVRDLGSLRPDLVVNTGDNIAHRDSVPVLLDALGDLLDVPGVFVFGSNDYYSPTLRNPVRYLLPDDGTRHVDSDRLPFEDLRRAFKGAGWLDLTNRRDTLTVGGTSLAFAGVDDPHLSYDDLDAIAGPADAVGRRPGRRRARAVPAGARPARGRRLRRDLRGAHPRRPGVRPGRRRPHHQLRPRAGPRARPAPPSRGLAAGRAGLVVAARLGRARHLARTPRSGSRAVPRPPC